MAKKGGGGPSNQIGEVSIGTSVDSSGAQAGLAKLEGTARASAGRVGASFGGIRGLFSKLFVPVAVFGSVSKLIDLIQKAETASDDFRKSLDESRKAFSDPISLAAYAGRAGVNQFDVLRAELLAKAKETRDQIDQMATQQLMDKWRLLDQNLGGMFGTLSGKEIREQAERQQRMMTDAVEQGLKNIADSMARELAKVLKDHLDKQREQANKYLESIAIDSARHRQIAESMQTSQHRGP